MTTLRALFTPRGGIHPGRNKDATANQPIRAMPLPKTFLVALNQHLGSPARAIVRKGDAVLRGQPLAEPAGNVSSWVHAPTSGTVTSIVTRLTANAQPATVVELAADGLDQALVPPPPHAPWDTLPSRELLDLILKSGVIGMGGAGFPTHIKLCPPPGKTLNTLIINGAECEPFLTADHRLMVEQSSRIWSGAQIIKRILGVSTVMVAIEDDKPDAIAAFANVIETAGGNARLVVLKTAYPQGAERQLIYACTGLEVPAGGLPMDVGCLVENVATAAAVHDAVVNQCPLTERVITLTGDAIAAPGNVLTRVGTPFRDLVAYGGGFRGDVGKIIAGGPMMGMAQSSLDVGVNKTTSGLLVLSRARVSQFTSMPCIRCGRCVKVCPAGLMSCHISESVEAEHIDEAEALYVLDCMECGACAFECPAHRPLVQHIRRAKALVMRGRRQRDARTAAQGTA